MEDIDLSSIKRDFSFQKKEYWVKWIFWLLMVLFLFADFIGVFGKGKLSTQTVLVKNAIIEYDKFLRVKKESMLVVQSTDIKNLTISFNDDYFRDIKVLEVFPEPQSMKVKNGRIIYDFQGSSNGQIIFFLEPSTMGRHKLDLQISGRSVTLNQFVYF